MAAKVTFSVVTFWLWLVFPSAVRLPDAVQEMVQDLFVHVGF